MNLDNILPEETISLFCNQRLSTSSFNITVVNAVVDEFVLKRGTNGLEVQSYTDGIAVEGGSVFDFIFATKQQLKLLNMFDIGIVIRF